MLPRKGLPSLRVSTCDGAHISLTSDAMSQKSAAVYDCIIQRDGSGFIISWTQHRTLEDAIREAEEEVESLAAEEKNKPSERPRAA